MRERPVRDRHSHVGAGEFVATTYVKAHHLIIYGMDMRKYITGGIAHDA